MIYTLKRDGSFSSSPLAMSGTWIQGRWKVLTSSNDLSVQVEGRYGGINQTSPLNQFITERLTIQPGILHDTSHPETDTYRCSVTVNDSEADIPQLHPLNLAPLRPAKFSY
jgi:hypothetical protein